MYWVILLLSLFGSGAARAEKRPQQCLSYEPAVVLLKGEIKRVTFPGPPNYESVAEGDSPETYWVLHLTEPICVNGKENSLDTYDTAETNVSDLQLGLDPEQYTRYKDLLGKPIAVSGTLSHSFTGHHHTDVLLRATGIQQK